jgi:hypothetical protein
MCTLAGILVSWYDPENRGSDTVAVYVADTTAASTRDLGTAQVGSSAAATWCTKALHCSRQVVHGNHTTCSSDYNMADSDIKWQTALLQTSCRL